MARVLPSLVAIAAAFAVSALIVAAAGGSPLLAFAALAEGAFGAFLMLGDPDLETSARLLDEVIDAGADMIEVGIPFSDPVADGPVIQAAAVRALARGVRTADCFALIRGFRGRHPDVPIGILTYANLVLARGRDANGSAARPAAVQRFGTSCRPWNPCRPAFARRRTSHLEHPGHRAAAPAGRIAV